MSNRPSRTNRYTNFEFTRRSFDPSTGEIQLEYRLGDLPLCERFFLPHAVSTPSADVSRALDSALDLLHWIAGISYWKTFCPADVSFLNNAPDPWQATVLSTFYREGLGEFAWHHQLDLTKCLHFPASGSGEATEVLAPVLGLRDEALLPLGGGKDSVVAWERMSEHLGHKALMGVQVGSSPLIQALGQWMVSQGYLSEHWVISRSLDPTLSTLNAQGAMNGHVPITAINSAVLAVFALSLGIRWVCFANERSADEPTLTDHSGRSINHQYSKSFAFEQLFDQWMKRYVAADFAVFSILRRDRELAIAKQYAKLVQFHPHCSSCNRNFHIDPSQRTHDRWCGQCPKCQFVFLVLAVFMSPSQLVELFGHDLLADERLIDGFQALLGLNAQKPFECVGEVAEARAAVAKLADSPSWRSHAVIQALAPQLEGVDLVCVEDLMAPSGPHLIPPDFL